MNREQAERLLAALIFDDLDEASKAELLAYLQTDDELRDRLRDLQMTVKLAGDAVNEGPEPVLSERRLKQLQQLARTRKTTRRIFTLRPLMAVAAVVAVGLVLAATFTFSPGNYVRKLNVSLDEVGTATNMDQTHSTAPATRPYPRAASRAPARAPGPGTDDIVSSAVAELERRRGDAATDDKAASAGGREYVDEPRQNAPAAGERYVGRLGGQEMPADSTVASDAFSTRSSAAPSLPELKDNSARDSSTNRVEVQIMRGQSAQHVEGVSNRSVEDESLAKSKSGEVPPGMGGLGRGTAGSGSGMMGGMGGYGGVASGDTDLSALSGWSERYDNADVDGEVMKGMMGGMGGYSAGATVNADGTTPPVTIREKQEKLLMKAQTLPADATGKTLFYEWSGAVTPKKPPVSVTTPAPSGPATTSDRKLDLAADIPGPQEPGSTIRLGDAPVLGGHFDHEFGAKQDSRDLVLMRDARLDSSATADLLYPDEIRYPKQLEGAKRPGAEEADAGLPSQSHFKTVPVNPWVMTERDSLSTFALDVDAASYALCRRYILNGVLPPAGAVRMEEFINAFDYAYPQRDEATFAVYAEGAPAPFAPTGQDLTLLRIAVKARTVGRDQRRAAHLVFVVDASASMGQADRLPAVQSALSLLVDKLSDADRISLVTCAGDARLHLEAVPAREKDRIRQTVAAIQPAGSTNLAAGLKLGYSLARRAFVAGQINQVVLCSDGVANVGQTEAEAILQEIAEDRKQGITITCVGVGYGAYNDALLEAMADRGDGRYVFLDAAPQAREALVGQLAATLQTVARDARIQVQFNPARVRRYRLIGYENRDIEDQRFRDDTVDAGEVGSGQCSTALYELELAGPAVKGEDADLGTVFVRYRNAENGGIEEIARPLSGSMVRCRSAAQDPRFFLAAGAARFAEWLRQSEHAQHTSLLEVQRLLDEVSVALPLDRDVQDLAALAHRVEGLPRAP